MNPLRNKALHRRTFLRGVGAALALPYLDCMLPAVALGGAAKTPADPRRFVAICTTLGLHQPFFTPTEDGPDYRLSPYLEPLASHRDKFTVFSGLSHVEQNGNNGHASEMTWLTAARRPGLAGFRNTISVDQWIAEKTAAATRFPYLALCSGQGGSLSWSSSGVEIPSISQPSTLYRHLFITGTENERNQQMQSLQRGKSILDSVRDQAKQMERRLGAADKQKLAEYFNSVRELENQMVMNEGWVNKPKPTVDRPMPTDIKDQKDFVNRVRLLNELMLLALQTDSTRLVTLRLSGLNQVPLVQGVSHDWHQLSHHGKDPEKIEELKLIELAAMQELAALVGSLDKINEQSGTLLDNTSILFGSNLGNASSHDWHNLPVLVAGGRFRHGSHLRYNPNNNERFSNLLVSLAQWMGVESDEFGTSSGAGVPGFEFA